MELMHRADGIMVLRKEKVLNADAFRTLVEISGIEPLTS